MKSKFKIVFLICFLLFQNVAISQRVYNVDSLKQVVSLEKDPEKKIKLLLTFTNLTTYSNPDLALEFAQQTISIANEHNKELRKIQAWIKLSNIYTNKSDYRSSLVYANKAKYLSADLGYDKEYAKSLNLISLNYFILGDYSKSSELNFEALSVVEKSGDKLGTLNMLNRIGSDYYTQKDYDKAYEYFSRSLAIAKDLENPKGIAQGLNNVGAVLKYRDEYEKFESNIREAIEINKKIGRRLWEGINYSNLGELYDKQSQLDSSIYYIEKSHVIFKELNSIPNLISSNLDLSSYYEKIGNTEKSLQYAIKAYELAESNNLKNGIKNAAEALQILYSEKNDLVNAYKFSRIEIQMIDSLNNESKIGGLPKLEIIYELKKLEQENKIKQQKKELTYIISGISLVFIFILLLIILKNRSRIKRKDEEIEKRRLETELEIKNKELTTNVMYSIQKNNLLTTLTEELLDIRKNVVKEETRSAIRRISKKIQISLKESVWDEFEIRFHQVHNEFYSKLSVSFPDLTSNEKRLCAFLRLEMSSKEISNITGQSVSAIEMARVRLRKKLGITNKKINLITFLSKL